MPNVREHPLQGVGVKIKHYKSFGAIPTGVDEVRPINIVIGRNNSGKSALLDAVELAINSGGTYSPPRHDNGGHSYTAYITHSLDALSLMQVFPKGTRNNAVPGDDQWEYGKQLVGHPFTRSYTPNWTPAFAEGPPLREIVERERERYRQMLVNNIASPLRGIGMIRIAAERDVMPEPRDPTPRLHSNGQGTTNIVRAFINQSMYPRAAVEKHLLNDLNEVYRGDCDFQQIVCREDQGGTWEIYLSEAAKGDIALSQSGSSLKSVFILLAYFRLYQYMSNLQWDSTVVAMEEPENNLHPALLRRLLDFLAKRRDMLKFTLFVTTHSPICIDWAARRSDSQIVHVRYAEGASTCSVSAKYSDSKLILDDLDIRASDILQANGIIWVEGPSDRIYIRRWLDIISGGQLREGVHYGTMFYGGKLLAHIDALPPREGAELVGIISINRNVAIVMDSDRHLGSKSRGKVRKPRQQINATKRRVMEEVRQSGGYVWITEGREIENYLHSDTLSELVAGGGVNIGQYDQVITAARLAGFGGDKIRLAHAAGAILSEEQLDRLDLRERLLQLAGVVRGWNRLPEMID